MKKKNVFGKGNYIVSKRNFRKYRKTFRSFRRVLVKKNISKGKSKYIRVNKRRGIKLDEYSKLKLKILKPTARWLVYRREIFIGKESVGKLVSIYNGSRWFNIRIKNSMVGFRFGEFSPTKQLKVSMIHRGNKIEIKKNKKLSKAKAGKKKNKSVKQVENKGKLKSDKNKSSIKSNKKSSIKKGIKSVSKIKNKGKGSVSVTSKASKKKK